MEEGSEGQGILLIKVIVIYWQNFYEVARKHGKREKNEHYLVMYLWLLAQWTKTIFTMST